MNFCGVCCIVVLVGVGALAVIASVVVAVRVSVVCGVAEAVLVVCDVAGVVVLVANSFCKMVVIFFAILFSCLSLTR